MITTKRLLCFEILITSSCGSYFMKTLVLYMTFFRLPDDFDGGISDALRLMADYHDHVTGGGPDSVEKGVANGVTTSTDVSIDLPFSEVIGIAFDKFINAIEEGKRLNGILQLKDFDPRVKIIGP